MNESQNEDVQPEEYPSDTEIEGIIQYYIGLEDMQKYLKDKHGLFIYTHKTENIANISRRILFGYEDVKNLRKLTQESQAIKSSGFLLQSEFSREELISKLKTSKRRRKTFYKTKEIQIDSLNEISEKDQLELWLRYTNVRPSRTRLLNTERKTMKIIIEGLESENILPKITLDYEQDDEFYATRDFLKEFNKENEKIFRYRDLNIDKLDPEEIVVLFDDILDYPYENWKLDDVTRIGIRKGEEIREMEYQDFQGIREAILQGEGLRSNSIVEDFLDSGYYFHSLSMVLQSKKEPKKVALNIDFKRIPRYSFDLTINEEYEVVEKNGKMKEEKTNFPEEETQTIRDSFRTVVMKLYSQFFDYNPQISKRLSDFLKEEKT